MIGSINLNQNISDTMIPWLLKYLLKLLNEEGVQKEIRTAISPLFDMLMKVIYPYLYLKIGRAHV
mgnify:CR=1 FL=1